MTILNMFLETCFQIHDLTTKEKKHTLHLRTAQKYKDGLAVGVVLVLLCLLFNGDMPWPLIQYGMIVAGVLDMGFVVMAIAYNRLSEGVTVATIKEQLGLPPATSSEEWRQKTHESDLLLPGLGILRRYM